VIFHCPDCGTPLTDDGGLWCETCERPVAAVRDWSPDDDD
jgi:uncharacterized Zn finger protein (UPF0148 family)